MAKKHRRKKTRSLGWIYLIISAMSATLSLCLFCSVSYILTEFEIISPTEKFGEGLFFFCVGPLVLAVLIGTTAILIARKYREKIAPADEYIDAGVSSLMEMEEEPDGGDGSSPGDEPGEKRLTE